MLVLYIFFILTMFTGERSATMNIHLLIHLTKCVENWGPLWAYSCFPFESMNYQLKKLFHGSQNMTKQVNVPVIVHN